MKKLLTICFVFFTLLCKGQNLSTDDGLKYGIWVDTMENINPYGRVIHTGRYEIISVSTYPIISKSNGDIFYEVKYLNSSANIFYPKIVKDSFSVSDGIWNRFDSLGKPIGSILWKQGIMLSSRDYDSNGNLVYFDTLDYHLNIHTTYRYIANRIFSKKQSNINGDFPTYDYYPSDKLTISNAEPNFVSDFLNKPIDKTKIILFANDNIDLIGVKDSSNSFKFLDSKMNPLSFPFKIFKNSKAVIYVLFNPSPSSLRSSEVFTLMTNELEKNEYPIYAKTVGYHLNYENVEKVSKFSLSISKDKFLVLQPMGTVTTTSITYPSGEVKFYNIDELTKIELSGLSPGKYFIKTISCDAGGSQIMILGK